MKAIIAGSFEIESRARAVIVAITISATSPPPLVSQQLPIAAVSICLLSLNYLLLRIPVAPMSHSTGMIGLAICK